TDEELVLWEALQDVQEVRVLESSTTYKDPTFEAQQSMQLLTLMGQLFPLFAQTGEVPNLKRLAEDVLRASGRHDTQDYFIQASASVPQAPQQLPPVLPQG